MTANARWPALPLAAWRATCDTLHMYAQIVGKIRLALAPAEPEWAHVALYVTPLGLTTGPIPYEGRTFQIDFDFIGHTLDIADSDGRTHSIPLVPRSVAAFYRELMAALEALQIDVRIWTMPVEVAHPIRFEDDQTHASYDPESARDFARALTAVDTALAEHRAPFRGRHTRVQFFFGTFDLAYARFSGRPATPPSQDVIMKNAMDAEEICVGFWPGDDRFPEPAFWCYAYPKPAGAEKLAIQPSAAFWSEEMGEFVLRYEDVRKSDDPAAAVRAFLTSTFEGLAQLARWGDA